MTYYLTLSVLTFLRYFLLSSSGTVQRTKLNVLNWNKQSPLSECYETPRFQHVCVSNLIHPCCLGINLYTHYQLIYLSSGSIVIYNYFTYNNEYTNRHYIWQRIRKLTPEICPTYFKWLYLDYYIISIVNNFIHQGKNARVEGYIEEHTCTRVRGLT